MKDILPVFLLLFLLGRWASVEDSSFTIAFWKDSLVTVLDHRTDALQEGTGRYALHKDILTIRGTDVWDGKFRVKVSGDNLILIEENGRENRFMKRPKN